MNQTSPPDALPPAPTDPSGHALRRSGLRRLASPLVTGAVALLFVGGAGGYLLARPAGSSTHAVDPAVSAAFDPTGNDAAPPGPGGYGPGYHHGFGPGQGTAGVIDSVSGTTITLTTRDGRKVTVTAAEAVPVIVRSQGSVADLKPGQTIVVSGSTGSDGNVIANRIAVGIPK